jgi:N-acetylglutamate synthase-like GNAT family acetyltransferase
MNDYTISDDKNKIDLKLVHQFLTNSYWAKGRSFKEVKTSIDNSICFGIYNENTQVGFARIVTDFVTIAYLLDVFIVEEYRGNGLSKILLKNIFEDERFVGVKKWMLATLDAHSLYKKFGFKTLNSSEKLMAKL